jgi:hypothetical protein
MIYPIPWPSQLLKLPLPTYLPPATEQGVRSEGDMMGKACI